MSSTGNPARIQNRNTKTNTRARRKVPTCVCVFGGGASSEDFEEVLFLLLRGIFNEVLLCIGK